MQKRRILILTILCCCLAITPLVTAGYASSLMYSKFNSTNWTEYKLDKTYTTLTASVKCRLDLSDGKWAKVGFFNQPLTNDSLTDPKAIEVIFNSAGTVTAYYIDGPTEIEIGTGSYVANSTSAQVVLSGGKVTIYADYGAKTQQKIVDGFSFGEPISYVRAKGTANDTATNGYLQVDVNVGASGISGDVTDTMSVFIPIIVLFAMLGMVLGLLKKLGKV